MDLHAMKPFTKQAFICVVILLLGLFLIDRMFPKDEDIKKTSEVSTKDFLHSLSQKKEVIKNEKVIEVNPINSIPYVPISVYVPSIEPADESPKDSIADRPAIDRVDRLIVENNKEPQHVNTTVEPEPKKDTRVSAPTLEVIGCDILELDKLNKASQLDVYECVDSKWIRSNF